MRALLGWHATAWIASSCFLRWAVISCTHVLLSRLHRRREQSWPAQVWERKGLSPSTHPGPSEAQPLEELASALGEGSGLFTHLGPACQASTELHWALGPGGTANTLGQPPRPGAVDIPVW